MASKTTLLVCSIFPSDLFLHTIGLDTTLGVPDKMSKCGNCKHFQNGKFQDIQKWKFLVPNVLPNVATFRAPEFLALKVLPNVEYLIKC